MTNIPFVVTPVDADGAYQKPVYHSQHFEVKDKSFYEINEIIQAHIARFRLCEVDEYWLAFVHDNDWHVFHYLKLKGRKGINALIDKMEIGDSFAVLKLAVTTIRARIYSITKLSSRKFTVLAYEGAYRCWRIA